MTAVLVLVALLMSAFSVSVVYTNKLDAQESIPSSKAAVALGDLVALGDVVQSGKGESETNWTTVMRTYIKTANQKELSADVSLQCGLITDTTVKSKGGGKDSSSAEGEVRVRVRAQNINTAEVRFFEPNEDGDTEQGVRFCERIQEMEASFAGLNCTVDDLGVVTCEDPEELRLMTETLNANAFNFLLPDATSGTWQIDVQAKAKADVELGGTELGDGEAQAFIGLGSTRIEELRLVKDSDTGPIVDF